MGIPYFREVFNPSLQNVSKQKNQLLQYTGSLKPTLNVNDFL